LGCGRGEVAGTRESTRGEEKKQEPSKQGKRHHHRVHHDAGTGAGKGLSSFLSQIAATTTTDDAALQTICAMDSSCAYQEFVKQMGDPPPGLGITTTRGKVAYWNNSFDLWKESNNNIFRWNG
jgi:hypothetical protein